MAEVKTARDRVNEQRDRIGYLRGTGPNPFQYDLWEQRTREVVHGVFGEDSAELAAYDEQVGKRGRLPGVRGAAENMSLNIHGQWGILGRLERADALLEKLAGQLG